MIPNDSSTDPCFSVRCPSGNSQAHEIRQTALHKGGFLLPIFQYAADQENTLQGSTGRRRYISVTVFTMHICSQALSGFLSGFYLCRMIYRLAIKKPFTGVLEA